jgi:hypothetical protein
MIVTNVPAYSAAVTITIVKSFIVWAPEESRAKEKI